MSITEARTAGSIAETARSLAREGFNPPGEKRFGSDAAWQALRRLGTELWLDTGDLDAAAKIWTDEFSNLTTNNTLVNKEVQKGLFDDLIRQAGRALRAADPALSTDQLVVETGFVVNCRTALRLVEAFDATVSVELHPAMAHDAAQSIAYGRRYYQVCPEKFIVKVPLTPSGFLAARRLVADGIPINYTLGFSARQNVLAAGFSRPAFVNVFLGRLNSFVKDNGLGDGHNVGEKAAMASQDAMLEGRRKRGWVSRQIAASMRSGEQLHDLAGMDVFTAPTGAADEFKQAYHASPKPLQSGVGREFEVHAEPAEVVDVLWGRLEPVHRAVEALNGQDAGSRSAAEFAAFVRDQGVPDLFHDWTSEERRQIQADGKVPKWERWKADLTSGRIALDDLMTESALQSFVKDQEELDGRIRRLLEEAGVTR